MKSQTLYFQSGSSDKVYQASIEAVPDGYLVSFAYGRRGSTLTTGCKTPAPVSLEKAEKVFQSLINSKLKKGYQEGEAGSLVRSADNPYEHSGVHLQLLNPIDEAEVMRYCRDDNYCAQEKYDGQRRAVSRRGEQVQGINKKGMNTSLASAIADHALSFTAEQFVLDGEAIGDTLYAFDLLECNGADLRGDSYHSRYTDLCGLVADDAAIVVVDTAFTTAEKLALLERVRNDGKEGVVFKRIDKPHSAGRPASGGDQLKFKCYATASVIVSSHNEGVRSVSVACMDQGFCVPLGNVSIPTNHTMPAVGAVIEVRYLYMYRNGSLYQPVYLGERDDVEPRECLIDQMKYKPEMAA